MAVAKSMVGGSSLRGVKTAWRYGRLAYRFCKGVWRVGSCSTSIDLFFSIDLAKKNCDEYLAQSFYVSFYSNSSLFDSFQDY